MAYVKKYKFKVDDRPLEQIVAEVESTMTKC